MTSLINGLPFPKLYLEILSNTSTNFGPIDARSNTGANAKAKAVIHDASSVGFSQYSRFPSTMFFTIPQDSVHQAGLIAGLDHVRLWYANPRTDYGPVLVFNGRLGDPSSSGTDVVWTAWSYLAELALSRTGYEVMYKNKRLGDIVTQEWSGTQSPATGTAKYPRSGDSGYGAKTQEHSLLSHVATGTIQTPVNSAASHDVKTDAQFGVIDVPRLLLFFDLTEMGRANTTQNVIMRVTRSLTPTFDFLKNAGTALTAPRLMFPGNIADYRYAPGVMSIRNDLATIGTKGSKATEIVKRIESGTYGSAAFGRRQDTFPIKTLAGYGNINDEATGKYKAQQQVTDAAVKQASQLTKQLVVDIMPGEFEPFDGYDIEDTVRVQIKRGRDDINQVMRIVGIRGRMGAAGYDQSLILALPTT